MQPLSLRRPRLKRRRIRHHSGEIAIVQEIEHFLALLQSDERALLGGQGGQSFALGLGEPVVGVDEAGAEDEDVPVLEDNVVRGGAGFDLRYCDGVSGVWVEGLIREAPVIY